LPCLCFSFAFVFPLLLPFAFAKAKERQKAKAKERQKQSKGYIRAIVAILFWYYGTTQKLRKLLNINPERYKTSKTRLFAGTPKKTIPLMCVRIGLMPSRCRYRTKTDDIATGPYPSALEATGIHRGDYGHTDSALAAFR
jgi:hypothetical protein